MKGQIDPGRSITRVGNVARRHGGDLGPTAGDDEQPPDQEQNQGCERSAHPDARPDARPDAATMLAGAVQNTPWATPSGVTRTQLMATSST
jgi:hypothetical protein